MTFKGIRRCHKFVNISLTKLDIQPDIFSLHFGRKATAIVDSNTKMKEALVQKLKTQFVVRQTT